ncbi:MAG: ATP-binding protein [Gemmatimonadaceae bacterium]
MTAEDQHVERKSLRLVTGRNPDWHAIACACVCFANGDGGRLLLGIEDSESLPPAGQRIPTLLPEQLRKRIGELTVNVQAYPVVQLASNGGEYLEIVVQRSSGVASTRDGRFFVRVADHCVPIVGDEVLRLASDRPQHPWETLDSGVAVADADPAHRRSFIDAVRASDRVKPSVKEKSDAELLTHYALANGATLTQLGLLLIGSAAHRRSLGTAPIVQAIRYDESGKKINKWTWDDGTLSPLQLPDAIWREIPDFRESYEVPEGMLRPRIPAYDEKVVRELLVNALVHRPYTQQGDLFLNLHPDRLELVNPGRLPIGVTPRNILHASRRRNEGLARVFHDLGLMEREGSGFDLMYDVLLSGGRPAPVLVEGADSVRVTIQRRLLKPEVARLMAEADARFQLTQRERITLGALAQSEGMAARELAQLLNTDGPGSLGAWLGRLLDLGLVRSVGRTKGTRYFVAPAAVREAGVLVPTTLRRVEPHILDALVCEDLRRHPLSGSSEMLQRLGDGVSRDQLKRALARLMRRGIISSQGRARAIRYSLVPAP